MKLKSLKVLTGLVFKTNAIAALSLLLGQPLFGQGTFAFQNKTFGLDAPVFDFWGNRLSGSIYRAELYGGITPETLQPARLLAPSTIFSTQRVAAPFLEGNGAGYFIPNTAVWIWDVPDGALAWLQVRAWDTRVGATYEDALASGRGGFGESPLFQGQSGCPNCAPPVSPSYLFGLQSFSLRAVVPEPSTWALLALGGLSLWWHVRRRS